MTSTFFPASPSGRNADGEGNESWRSKHAYSVGTSQMPTATRVAGFWTWKNLGRSVNAGAKGTESRRCDEHQLRIDWCSGGPSRNLSVATGRTMKMHSCPESAAPTSVLTSSRRYKSTPAKGIAPSLAARQTLCRTRCPEPYEPSTHTRVQVAKHCLKTVPG
jgi:hypothetical protein